MLNASPMYIGSLGVEFYLVEAQEFLLFHFKLTKVFLWPPIGKKLWNDLYIQTTRTRLVKGLLFKQLYKHHKVWISQGPVE